MKILAIGNSFSEDATTYLYSIAKNTGEELYVVNLYIGGCSLEQHAKNLKTDEKLYGKFINTHYIDDKVSIKDTLLSEVWDIVSIQQVSQYSGLIETYEPYATELIDAIKKYAPLAKIYFHQTWAYEIDSKHEGFVNYGGSQSKMAEMIFSASEDFCKQNCLDVIPCGRVITELRRTVDFDYSSGGKSLCRDGFHMSMDYGRYATAATWFQTLTGTDIFKSSFAPENTEEEKINIIKAIVKSVCKK